MPMFASQQEAALFERMYLETKARAYQTAYNVLHSRESAEDAVSESYFRIAQVFSRISCLPERRQHAYVLITVRNTALNLLRSEQKYRGELEYIDEIYTPPAESEADSPVTAAVLRLSESDRQILYLRFELELDYREISTAMHISRAAARQRVRLAKKHLKQNLEESGYETDKRSLV